MSCFRVAALLVIAMASAASACDEFVKIDKAQTITLMNTMSNDQSAPLEQLFAFETLMCSDQPGVRDLTLRTGLQSSNPSIQGQVLFKAVMEMESIPILLLEKQGLSKEQYERIKQRPIENLSVSYRDTKLACLSFSHREKCDPNNVMSITGTRASIRTRFNGHGLDGEFRLQNGALEGLLTFTREKQTFPARIDLF